ncbi:MAG: RNase adapter RapZ [Microbacterium sp.]|nr:RNase adapter RapZ [Microbacterium sp.]
MEPPREQPELLIVTGMSGAGRSTVANALEDIGWYVVDNLPPEMLPMLADVASRASDALGRIAAVVDVRGGRLFEGLRERIRTLRERDISVRVLFLDANDDVLVTRFEQVRRPHPLQGSGTLLDGIGEERRRMLGVREESDQVIDTSTLNVHQLSRAIAERFADSDRPGLTLTLMSFGFKYGSPTDADMLADARFIPNPFWIPELREGTGLDAAVREFVLGQPGAEDFVRAYAAALRPVLEGYMRENKRHATIAVGCTGGRHRSVAVVERLAELLRGAPAVAVSTKHRDLGRE